MTKTIFDRRVLIAAAAFGIVATAPIYAHAATPGLTVIAEIDAKPENADQLRATMVPFAVGTRKEPGCLSYTLFEDSGHPGHFYTYEIWTDDAALDAHLTSPTMKAAGAKLGAMLERAPIITRLKKL